MLYNMLIRGSFCLRFPQTKADIRRCVFYAISLTLNCKSVFDLLNLKAFYQKTVALSTDFTTF